MGLTALIHAECVILLVLHPCAGGWVGWFVPKIDAPEQPPG